MLRLGLASLASLTTVLSGAATSGDSGRIFYQCCESDARIVVVDADGTHRRELAGFRLTPAWSPDGAEIAFVGNGGTALVRIRVNGTHRRVVIAGLYCCAMPDWTGRS